MDDRNSGRDSLRSEPRKPGLAPGIWVGCRLLSRGGLALAVLGGIALGGLAAAGAGPALLPAYALAAGYFGLGTLGAAGGWAGAWLARRAASPASLRRMGELEFSGAPRLLGGLAGRLGRFVDRLSLEGEHRRAGALLREAHDAGDPSARGILGAVSVERAMLRARKRLTKEGMQDFLAAGGPAAVGGSLLEKSVEAGDPRASAYLGALLLNGGFLDGMEGMWPKDQERGIRLIEASAEAGDPDGLRQLGLAVHRGQCGPRDPAKAGDLWLRAVSAGSSAAKVYLGSLCVRGEAPEGMPGGRFRRDCVKRFVQEAVAEARSGDRLVMAELGRLSSSGAVSIPGRRLRAACEDEALVEACGPQGGAASAGPASAGPAEPAASPPLGASLGASEAALWNEASPEAAPAAPAGRESVRNGSAVPDRSAAGIG